MSDVSITPDVCPNPATLSAYVDGTVDASARRSLEAHLGDCEVCYAVVVETMRAVDASPEISRPSWSRRTGFLVAATGLALAAGMILAIWIPTLADRTTAVSDATLAAVVRAVGPERLIEPRLTGGFEYGPLRGAVRSASSDRSSLQLLTAVGDAVSAARAHPSAETQQVAAIGHVLVGQYDDAIAALDTSCPEATNRSRCESDLGAAYLARGAAGDLDRAATHIHLALQLAPALREAAFNEALLLERTGRTGDALAAWTHYLSLDNVSAWASEARLHIRRLTS
jgi:tetratricopeptide (TPR) repeat protein